MKPATPAADPGPLAPPVGALNALCQYEAAAVETYDQALKRFEDHPFYADLRTIRYHHETAAGVLRDHVRNFGSEPPPGFGPWVVLLVDQSNPETILASLHEAEEQGVNEYERVMQAEELPQECRFALRSEVLPHCHEDLDTLAAMISASAKKG